MASHYDESGFWAEQDNINFDNVQKASDMEIVGVTETKIDWRAKLSSRKFWALVVGFVSPLLLAFGVGENTVTQVAAIIAAGGAVIAYLFAEGMVDASRENGDTHLYVGGGGNDEQK